MNNGAPEPGDGLGRGGEVGLTPSGGSGLASSGRTDIGWLRAIVSGSAIVFVTFIGAMYLPQKFMLAYPSMDTDRRALIAGAISISTVIVMAFVLRALQRRRMI